MLWDECVLLLATFYISMAFCNFLSITYYTLLAFWRFYLNPFRPWVWDSYKSKGGRKAPTFGNQQRSLVIPYVAKSHFETYKNDDHLQKIRSLSQKLREILRFEKFDIMRFCLTLTQKNCHNSLNFWDTALIFWI